MTINNSTKTPPQPPRCGVYTPIVTFFHADESIDYDSITKHTRRLLDNGVSGLVIHGSTGEATHLQAHERSHLIRHVREVCYEHYPETVIIAGCNASSVRETLSMITGAHSAGAGYALVLPPSYWVAAMSSPVLNCFYTEVSNKSPLPVIIHNSPGVTSGIDLDSDLIHSLATTNPNIVGAKLACGNVGKLQRLSTSLPATSFAPFAGKADHLLPALVAGSHEVISALSNVVPKLHVEVLRLYQAGELRQAQEIQAKLSVADWALMKLGVSGVKAASSWFGYGSARPRRPLPEVDIGGVDEGDLKELHAVVEMEWAL